jgi:hypothetical protein
LKALSYYAYYATAALTLSPLGIKTALPIAQQYPLVSKTTQVNNHCDLNSMIRHNIGDFLSAGSDKNIKPVWCSE